MNFRKMTFILSDQPTGIQKTERIIRILKNDLYIPGQDPTKDRYTREVNSIKRFGFRKRR